MRHRWIRATDLGPALLAVVVLAVSSMSALSAQTVMEDKSGSPHAFWDQQGSWRDQATRKAIRPAQQPGSWEVLVDLSNDGEWAQQGLLKEIYRHRLEPSSALDEAQKSALESLGTVLLIGDAQPSQGGHLYVVAAVLEKDSMLQDSDGGALKPFVPLHVNESYQDAQRFAQTYEKLYDGSLGNGELPDHPQGDSEKGLKSFCDSFCYNQRSQNYSACSAQASSCLGSAYNTWQSCLASCSGTACNTCNTNYTNAQGVCTVTYNSCTAAADRFYQDCLSNCGDGGGGGAGGCSATNHTVTARLSLDDTTPFSEKLASTPVDFALSRSEKRDGESFVLDEWAVVQDGQVRVSSNPAFAAAATDQHALPALGSFLMIQEPIHEMNSRYVPKPEVRISEKALAPAERGEGEIVAARLELSPAGVVDRAEIVYTSQPLETSRLEKLISQRVGLTFVTGKGHRTAVYVVFRLTDHLEVLRTYTVLPKCCCGTVRCV